MENYIQISFLNDFVFCPRSVYFHQVYKTFDPGMYHEATQTRGKMAHQSIDQKKYSTRKNILQGLMVYSDQYSLCGRIDIFDNKNGILTERKRKIEKIYNGFVFQVYAQYYCLIEMGYKVNKICIYSLIDNKKYSVLLPEKDKLMDEKFKNLIKEINNFDLKKNFSQNIKKCKNCIYKHLCDYGDVAC